MTAPDDKWINSREFGYLCVDEFIKNFLDARALATAFEIGLIDFLAEEKSAPFDVLIKKIGKGGNGAQLLLHLLMANRVIAHQNDIFTLTGEFIHALQFRDLLELKLELSMFGAYDILDYFDDLACRPGEFVKKARFCGLFAYDRCYGYSSENYRLAKRWMRITTVLTKYEAQACMRYYDFSRHHAMMDIGGNSGEFALRICRNHPGIYATVFDLPLVCEIGSEHVGHEPEADRISFVKGNALTDTLPGGFDLISFKSMLHDWPEREALQLITHAGRSLKHGGTLLIFERGPIEVGTSTLPFSMVPFLLFAQSFRSPMIYTEHLGDLGFQDIRIQRIDLGMPFFLITGKTAAD